METISQPRTHQQAYTDFFKRDKDGRLIFCGMDVPKVMSALTDTKRGEPTYLVGTQIIEFQAKAAESALNASNTRRTYAIKANSNPAVLQIIRKQGIGAEVASVEELKLALASGFDAKDIVVDGIGKTREYFELAMDAGVPVINCNDLDELQLLNEIAGEKHKRPRVGLRVSPDIIETSGEGGGKISTGDDKSKFGIKLAQAEQVYSTAKQNYPHVDLVGIHCHLGSNIQDKQKFEDGYDKILGLVEKLHTQGVTLEYVDMGGGVGVPYTPYGALGLKTSEADSKLITIEQYGEILQRQRERLNNINPNLEFVSELGRYYVAPACLYMCQVRGENVKGEHTHINTTGNMGHLIRPAIYGSPHVAFPMVERKDAEVYGPNTEAVGNMCESGDKIALNCEGLQKQRKGDYLCFPSAGAYNPTMQLPTYNMIGSCSTILVHTDGKAYLTEQPISGIEYMRMKAARGATPDDLSLDKDPRKWENLVITRQPNRVYAAADDTACALQA
jgi:diaminopimelate decarboxylase